jgi:DNA modification methylase
MPREKVLAAAGANHKKMGAAPAAAPSAKNRTLRTSMKAPAAASAQNNRLYYGDNLAILQHHIPDQCADVIYLDPPFNSDADYNILFKERTGEPAHAQIKAFDDTWTWSEVHFNELIEKCPNHTLVNMVGGFVSALGRNDVTAYLVMMAPRLVELHRVLKDRGSLFLHCDPTASHYLKIILDSIFGPTAFRNEIIWRRSGSHNSARRFGPIHDVVLFYSKFNKDKPYFKTQYRPYANGHVDGYFKKADDRGRYWTNSIHGAGVRNGESGKEWKGYNPTAHGRHWAIPSTLIAELGIDVDLGVHEKLDALDALGMITHPADKAGLPTYRQYLHLSPGVPLQDIWSYQPYTRGVLYKSPEAIDEDVRWLVSQGDDERLGYPTQKPVGLLKRIIESTCPPDGVVLDPFCGCGTSIEAAHELKRTWIGIDITHLAISLIKYRLQDRFELQDRKDYSVLGEPVDAAGAAELAAADRYEFQKWAISLVPRAFPYQDKKGGDGGIDGLVRFRDDPKPEAPTKLVVIQVKSGHMTPSLVRDFAHVIKREKAQLGFFITLEKPTAGMLKEAGAEGFFVTAVGQKIPVYQIRTVEELLAGRGFEVPVATALVGGDMQGVRKAKAASAKADQGELGIDV